MKNNHSNMSTIKELLGQGDIPKPRKNFIQENVKRLKELKLEKTNKLSSQRSNTLQPLTERRNAQTMVSSSRLSQRHSVSQSPPRGRRTRHVTLDTRPTIQEEPHSTKGYRSQGCQTLNSKQLESLYEEGVVCYPSVRGEEEGSDTERVESVEVLHPPPPLEDGLHWDEEKKNGDKDFVKINATVLDPRRHKLLDSSSSNTDPTRAPATYQRGVVPKYIREHKKEMEKERINKAKEDECPEGHIQLPDDIKQKHLSTLRQNYADLVSQLNQLPVSTDTLRTRTRKKQIETDLDRIEAAIALFSREKVFVKADS
ncbi:uncharacterized protein LOC128990396 [Macrosteles quadrilineatus]|uniref:uncharacterized protein LOC128990396 n=1 Tax=Macrosteles quadrilineatus TaxID=74068 RepID=UPI0023E0EF07|nr:uncharacterized protein LOC128990396 [Macrosteles quadrilineatus]XP_054268720.1 uncharacterized protein LOC128990396 [Macrosteles quadrilineatus]